MDEKKRLRGMMLKMREALPEGYLEQAGGLIQERLLSLPRYQEADTLFLYVSTEKEPSTRRVLRRALECGKRVYVPKCVNCGEMLAARLKCMDDLVPGYRGILEPKTWTETRKADALDLILVPCVCASPDGKRLGYGGGYYDRFLAERADHAICLCFQRLLRDDIPLEDNDVILPAVLTENGLIT